ncbi:MAG TPA: serine/threonine-protein kinase, partial [Rubricoccaceae bacterium]|nr:serine/threonine-protein kinase [Rubricoccaceae bacterium]
MTPADRHARVSALFLDALDRPTDARAAWLAASCDDTDIRREVAALLTQHVAETGLLDRPALARHADGEAHADPRLGQRVGPWRLDAPLGRGGMGAVYRAVRADESFTQHAALKLMHAGGDADFRPRFLRERALLAGLDHPGVARLLDGGVTPDGVPYLAMELVDGEPITAHADRHRLGVEERLRLFLQACEAVAYAHRNLVVHRDLKPAHVLVDGRSERPQVKLLDFGIARLLSSDEALLTRTGPGPMTPAYAAPEQLLGQPVTTATDVYALGVVLYELLAGRRPYDVGSLTAAQAERVVCGTEPPRPSAVAPPERRRALRGDLDTIVQKAMAKEPARRYPSADALADDLRRSLDGLPVEARPATAGYRLGRFVRRHRAGVLAATAVVAGAVALVAFYTARLTAERDRALRATEVAQSETARAEAVAAFLEQILRAPNASWYVEGEAKGPDTPVRAVLDEAARRVDRDFAAQPDLQADLHHLLGDTYNALGLEEEADRHHVRVLAIR